MSYISPMARNVVECPFCKELVAKGAVRCRHCQADLKLPKKRRRRPFFLHSFMLGMYAATIFWLIIHHYLSKP